MPSHIGLQLHVFFGVCCGSRERGADRYFPYTSFFRIPMVRQLISVVAGISILFRVRRGSLERLIQGRVVLAETRTTAAVSVKLLGDGQLCECLQHCSLGLRLLTIPSCRGFLQMHGYPISYSQTVQILQ